MAAETALSEFVAGFRTCLKTSGVSTFAWIANTHAVETWAEASREKAIRRKRQALENFTGNARAFPIKLSDDPWQAVHRNSAGALQLSPTSMYIPVVPFASDRPTWASRINLEWQFNIQQKGPAFADPSRTI